MRRPIFIKMLFGVFFYYLIHLCNDCVCVVMSAILYWLFGCPVENLAQMKILMSMLRAIEAVNNKYSINYISMLNLRAIMITKNEKKKVFVHRCIDQQATIFICVSFRFVWFDFNCSVLVCVSKCLAKIAMCFSWCIHANVRRWICIGVIQQLLVMIE